MRSFLALSRPRSLRPVYNLHTLHTRHFAFALVHEAHGSPPTVLQARSHACPQLGPQDIRVDMMMAPINPSDLNMVEGVYGTLPPLPAVAGNEGVGTVTELGVSVEGGLAVGDWVVPVKPALGTWCSEAVWAAQDVRVVPRDLPLPLAASLFVNPCTAYRLLHDAVLGEGQVVAQNGATGGVGQLVIQMAKCMNLRTINVVRDHGEDDLRETTRRLTAMGADLVVTDRQLATQGRALLDGLEDTGDGAVLALNCVGGKPSADLARLLRPGGEMVVYGGMSRRPAMLGSGQFIFDDLRVSGFWLTRWMANHGHSPAADAMFRDIIDMARSGAIAGPEPSVVFPVDQLTSALEAKGKVFLDLRRQGWHN